MKIIVDAIQFIETSLLFSAFLFSLLMYLRTRDTIAKHSLFVVLPVSVILFFSFMYRINLSSSFIADINLLWLSPLFAFFLLALIMLSILSTCYYVIQLFPVPKHYKRIGLFVSVLLFVLLLVVTCFLVMYISKTDLTQAVTNALWAFYPLCSLALFLLAVILAFWYKRITDKHDKKMARFFLIAFLPQIVYGMIDFFLLKDSVFQLTHLSYTMFSMFVFYSLGEYFFRNYSKDDGVSIDPASIKEKFELSDRELEVLVLLVEGCSNQKLGERLHISVNTVKSHINKIYKKLDVSNRLQLYKKLK